MRRNEFASFMARKTVMIDYRNITVRAGSRTLLETASLQLNSGEKAVVRGPSGCGKSSLLTCLVGGMRLTQGSVHLDSIELSPATVADIRSRISFIGQEPVLGAERVIDAILLPFRFKAHARIRPEREKILHLLEALHLEADILEEACRNISGGEKQRIVILRAMLLDKKVFLADEVTSALDPESKAAVLEALFRPDITLLSVSHDADWIAACDRVIDFSNGTLVEGS
jgi:putative ABC transport system ATP-binding protein